MSIRIVLADDHAIFREGLRSLLEAESDIEVVGETGDGRQTSDLAVELKPDAVIMDVEMPDLNGIEATRQITGRAPSVKVICLSMHSRDRFVTAMMEAGASAYLLKDCATEELLDAIRAVSCGKTYVSPVLKVGGGADGPKERLSDEVSAFGCLTAREREVLQLYAEGATTKEIAYSLELSEKTVSTHRAHMMDKLNVRSIAELTKYAVREGMTSL